MLPGGVEQFLQLRQFLINSGINCSLSALLTPCVSPASCFASDTRCPGFTLLA
ncbi:MAG: hypothetical protein U0841_16210 [Chloroflexia bacterium]